MACLYDSRYNLFRVIVIVAVKNVCMHGVRMSGAFNAIVQAGVVIPDIMQYYMCNELVLLDWRQ